MKKNIAIVTLLLCVLSLSLFAAGSTESGDTAGSGKKFEGVTLKVHHASGFAEVLVVMKHAKEFEAATGAKLVFVESAWGEIDAKQNLAMSSKSGEFDLLYVGPRSYQLVQPFSVALDDYLVKDYGSVDGWKEMFPAQQIEINLGADGKVHSWPFHSTAQFGVYRKDLFEDPQEMKAFKAKYGYDLKPPSNYKELLDVATFFTRDTDGDGKTDHWGLVTCGDKWQGGALFYDQLYRNDIHPFDMKYQIELEDPEKRARAIEVARFMQDLVYKYKVMPPDTSSIGSAQMAELWKSGRGAISYGWWGDYFNVMKSQDIVDRIGETASFNIFPLDDKHGGVIAWSSWAISNDSKNHEAAYEFIKWATSKPIKMEVTRDYGYPPPVSAWAKEAIENGTTPPSLPEAIATGLLWPIISIPQSALINAVIQEQGNALFANATTPEKAIDAIEKGVREILIDAGRLSK
jgi:multiple sugar transport system substrate-binding protein